jgi:hypothetical protein
MVLIEEAMGEVLVNRGSSGQKVIQSKQSGCYAQSLLDDIFATQPTSFPSLALAIRQHYLNAALPAAYCASYSLLIAPNLTYVAAYCGKLAKRILRRPAEINYPKGCAMLDKWRHFHEKPNTN